MPIRSASLAAAAQLVLVAGAAAQYSSNAAANLFIADLPNDQVQPKVVAHPDGGCYISWFDNATGGYDVRLQRLDPYGIEMWPHNGILIADRAVSSTTDYDLAIDAFRNAIVAFPDDLGVSGTPQQTSVHKVSPTGVKLWGPSGVQVSAAGIGSANPHIAILSDGSYAVGYSSFTSPQTWIMQKLDSAGTPQWPGTGVTVSEASRYLALSDLKGGDNGSILALWIRGSTANATTSAKALYAQKFDASGAALWNAGAPVIVFNATSVQNGYFPTLIHDAAGGAVFGWYEIGGSRLCYVQHVLADGSFKFPAPLPGLAAGTRIAIGAGHSYNRFTGDYYLAWPESNASPQGDYSVRVQRFNAAGAQQWGSAGVQVLPQGTGNQPSFVQSLALDNGCYVFGTDTRSATTHVVFGGKVSGAGILDWSNIPSSTVVTKSRLSVALSSCGYAILAWHNGAVGSADIQAQNVNADGSLGLCYANCDCSMVAPILNVNDFVCFINRFGEESPYANCDASTIPPVLNVNDFLCFMNAFSAGCT